MTVKAIHDWPTNGDLIADVAQIHRIGPVVLDATYGRGRWWTKWQPVTLITNDLSRETEAEHHYDFRCLPWRNGNFDTVCFDPPYKLNGTPALGDFDDAYGINRPTSWQKRMDLICDGFAECARLVNADGLLLAKCQDQVCSGRMRWQTVELTNLAASLGLRLVDRFDMVGGSRPQPEGRRQVHARGRGSTLLVFGSAP